MIKRRERIKSEQRNETTVKTSGSEVDKRKKGEESREEYEEKEGGMKGRVERYETRR